MAYMSEEGYKKLMAELRQLEAVERPKMSAAIAEARDKGDLSENAEYDEAMNAQAIMEARIAKLEAEYEFETECVVDDTHTCIRLVTSWATPQSAVEDFVRYLAGLTQ